MDAPGDRKAWKSLVGDREGVAGPSPERAVVRLRGVREISPEALLAMAEGVRRALRLVGVVDVHIEVEADDDDVA